VVRLLVARTTGWLKALLIKCKVVFYVTVGDQFEWAGY